MLSRKQGDLLVRLEPSGAWSFRLWLRIQELRQNSRNATGGVLADKLRKRLFRIVTCEKLRDFYGLGRFIERGARRRHLNTPDHVAADEQQKRNGIGSYVRPKLLLKDLKKVAFRQVHLEHWVQLVIPTPHDSVRTGMVRETKRSGTALGR